jgi:hypothetical protein
MRKSLTMLAMICGLFAALCGSASAAPTLSSDPRVNPLSCRNFHIEIGFTGERFTERDWYGLYNGTPDPDNWSTGLVDGQWQWAKDGSTYQTNEQNGRFSTVYWTHNDEAGKYEIVSVERLQSIDCKS